jgi:hypothetical protein
VGCSIPDSRLTTIMSKGLNDVIYTDSSVLSYDAQGRPLGRLSYPSDTVSVYTSTWDNGSALKPSLYEVHYSTGGRPLSAVLYELDGDTVSKSRFSYFYDNAFRLTRIIRENRHKNDGFQFVSADTTTYTWQDGNITREDHIINNGAGGYYTTYD